MDSPLDDLEEYLRKFSPPKTVQITEMDLMADFRKKASMSPPTAHSSIELDQSFSPDDKILSSIVTIRARRSISEETDESCASPDPTAMVSSPPLTTPFLRRRIEGDSPAPDTPTMPSPPATIAMTQVDCSEDFEHRIVSAAAAASPMGTMPSPSNPPNFTFSPPSRPYVSSSSSEVSSPLPQRLTFTDVESPARDSASPQLDVSLLPSAFQIGEASTQAQTIFSLFDCKERAMGIDQIQSCVPHIPRERTELVVETLVLRGLLIPFTMGESGLFFHRIWFDER